MNELEVMEAQLAEVKQLQFPASLDLLDDRELWNVLTEVRNMANGRYKLFSLTRARMYS